MLVYTMNSICEKSINRIYHISTIKGKIKCVIKHLIIFNTSSC